MDQNVLETLHMTTNVYLALSAKAHALAADAKNSNEKLVEDLAGQLLEIGAQLIVNEEKQVDWHSLEAPISALFRAYFVPRVQPLNIGWDGVGPSDHAALMRAWQASFSVLWQAEIDYHITSGQQLVPDRAKHTLGQIHDVLFCLWPIDPPALHVRMTRLYYAARESLLSWPLMSPALVELPANVRTLKRTAPESASPRKSESDQIRQLEETAKRLADLLAKYQKQDKG